MVLKSTLFLWDGGSEAFITKKGVSMYGTGPWDQLKGTGILNYTTDLEIHGQ